MSTLTTDTGFAQRWASHCDQDKVWTSANGHVRVLSDMAARHAINIINKADDLGLDANCSLGYALSNIVDPRGARPAASAATSNTTSVTLAIPSGFTRDNLQAIGDAAQLLPEQVERALIVALATVVSAALAPEPLSRHTDSQGREWFVDPATLTFRPVDGGPEDLLSLS